MNIIHNPDIDMFEVYAGDIKLFACDSYDKAEFMGEVFIDAVVPQKDLPGTIAKLCALSTAAALAKHAGNKKAAAKQLGIARQTIQGWLKKNKVEGIVG